MHQSVYVLAVWINNLFSYSNTQQAWALCGTDISAQNSSSPAVMHNSLKSAPLDGFQTWHMATDVHLSTEGGLT